MFTPTNKLTDLLPYFKRKLADLYSPREIENIFYWVCEDLYSLSKIDVKHTEKRLTESELLHFRSIVKRLAKMEPLQYILGATVFYGCHIFVNKNTLIPRPETEELVDWILKSAENKMKVLDIGTGSGCIPIALKKQQPNLDVYAIDISEQALELAAKSAKENVVAVEWHQKDILTANLSDLPRFDIIVSNPPYVRESDKQKMSDNVLNHEPHLALFVSDDDPLLFYRRIATLALEALHPGGILFFEIHEDLANETKTLLSNLGYKNIQLKTDLQNKPRMIRCQR